MVDVHADVYFDKVISISKRGQAVTHAIERTSPKGPGQKFIGTCRLCGRANLTSADALKPCSNERGLSADEALLDALLPHNLGVDSDDDR